jgi:hypothetical protein
MSEGKYHSMSWRQTSPLVLRLDSHGNRRQNLLWASLTFFPLKFNEWKKGIQSLRVLPSCLFVITIKKKTASDPQPVSFPFHIVKRKEEEEKVTSRGSRIIHAGELSFPPSNH